MPQPFILPQLPEAFRAKIKSVFPNGEAWLRDLPLLVNSCIEQWKLSALEPSSKLYYNFICFADSAEYGPVVLKIGVPHEDFYIQLDSIARFNENYFCRLCAADKERGAVLLERIIPGNDLTTIPLLEDRTQIAAELIKHVPVKTADKSPFPTYAGWLEIAVQKVKKARPYQIDLLALTDQAAALFYTLPSNDSDERLLHGDLHHFNILFDAQHNAWKAIDPHGVIGYFGLEAGRFIVNQMEMEKNEEEARNALITVSKILGGSLKLPTRTIMTCAFVDTVLSTCWTTEESSPDEQNIIGGISNAKIILSCLDH
jgi:streptomycin 6-kinase